MMASSAPWQDVQRVPLPAGPASMLRSWVWGAVRGVGAWDTSFLDPGILATRGLARLHEEADACPDELATRETDQRTTWHARYYAAWDDARGEVVTRESVRPCVQAVVDALGVPCLYQRVPTLRVQVPGNLGVGEWHTDGDYGHPAGVLNVWMPLTPVAPSQAIWVDLGEGRMAWMACEVGEALVFPGATMRHGNVPNTTTTTRVSVDARVWPLPAYDPTYTGKSIAAGRVFQPGGYYADAILVPRHG